MPVMAEVWGWENREAWRLPRFGTGHGAWREQLWVTGAYGEKLGGRDERVL